MVIIRYHVMDVILYNVMNANHHMTDVIHRLMEVILYHVTDIIRCHVMEHMLYIMKDITRIHIMVISDHRQITVVIINPQFIQMEDIYHLLAIFRRYKVTRLQSLVPLYRCLVDNMEVVRAVMRRR